MFFFSAWQKICHLNKDLSMYFKMLDNKIKEVMYSIPHRGWMGMVWIDGFTSITPKYLHHKELLSHNFEFIRTELFFFTNRSQGGIWFFLFLKSGGFKMTVWSYHIHWALAFPPIFNQSPSSFSFLIYKRTKKVSLIYPSRRHPAPVVIAGSVEMIKCCRASFQQREWAEASLTD